MRKFLSIVVVVLIVLLLVAVGLLWIGLGQLQNPASSTSVHFTASFVERCVAAGQRGGAVDQSATGQSTAGQSAGDQPIASTDDMTALCQCGADDMREDMADAGLSGLARMVLIEGLDAKMQRVMDACQTTPSAP